MQSFLRRLRIGLRLIVILFVLAFVLGDNSPDNSRKGRIEAVVTPYEFNYVAWELETLWEKFEQEFFGYHAYIPTDQQYDIVLDYLNLVGKIWELDQQIETMYSDPAIANPREASSELRQRRDRFERERYELQSLAEPAIEKIVSSVLEDEGFGLMGQMVPPVSFRFSEPPDVLVVSPRAIIRQDFSISLEPLEIEKQSELEAEVEAVSPDDAAYITGVGGVGIWPAMVEETRYPAIAFEVVAHEWSHHYLIAFPLGYGYFDSPVTRNINETTATIFGNAVALRVLEKFYAEEVAAGEIWVPDYPTLVDFRPTQAISQKRENPDTASVFDRKIIEDWTAQQRRARLTANFLVQSGRVQAAELALNAWEAMRESRSIEIPRNPDMPQPPERAQAINRTRVTVDYLLALGQVDAAEADMEATRQQLGMRVLNQAWFAFNGGYQADPAQGGGVVQTIIDVADPAYGGDPTGPAIHEIYALAPDLHSFMHLMRDVTDRESLIQALLEARGRWGN